MKQYSMLVLATTVLVVAACAPASTQPLVASAGVTPILSSVPALPTNPRGTTPTVEPTLAPNPLNVKVKVDDQLAASATISSTGGIVSVKMGDGTKLSLSIPKDALPDDVKITLTPLTGVDGLPFSGGLVGAIQMAPEGLRLFQPATLAIEAPKATPKQGYALVAFAYHASGEGFYLTPAQAEGTKITIPVWHFSGGGVASGTADEIKTQQRRVPANPEDALNQRMVDYLSQQQQLAQQGNATDPELGKRTVAFLREYFNAVIKPQLAVAVQDCEASKTILPNALGWVRSIQLWGFDDELRAETDSVLAAFGEAIVNCYNKAYDKCVKDHDLSQLAVMMGYLRQATLLSPAEGGGLVSRLDQSKIEKCGSFDLQFENTISGDGTLYILDYAARATVPVRFRFPGGLPSGEAQIQLDFQPRSGNAEGYYRFLTSGAKGGTLQASLKLSNTSLGTSASGDTFDLMLWLKPGMNTESFTAQYCAPVVGCGAEFSSDEPGWFIFFQFLHEDEGGSGGLEIRNWNRGSGAVLAHKEYERTKSYNGHPVKEMTTLQLVHKAQ